MKGGINHFGRLASRVTARPSVRQPGPALRSDSPIAEHDQRLTSFDLGSAAVGGRDGGDGLEEAITTAETEAGPPSGAATVLPRAPRAAQAPGETDRRARTGSTERPSPAIGTPRSESMSEGAASPGASSARALPRPVSSSAIAESAPARSRGTAGAGLPAETAPAGAGSTVAALASAFARVQAWMSAPPVPRPFGATGAAARSGETATIDDGASVEAVVPSPRALATPRPAGRVSDSPSPLTVRLESEDLRGGGGWSAPSAAVAAEVRGGLEIGHLSVQVLPPPAPPVPRERAARSQQRPEAAGFESGARRRGIVARLGFGMRHW